MLHLVLMDSEVELVPGELWYHPSVRRHSQRRGKKPGNMLLDSSFHHSAVRKVMGEDRANRRGRPDIAFICSVLAQESISCRTGRLRFYIHTREDKVLFFSPETRVPKTYHRFLGLIESVYLNGAIPSNEEPLISIEDMNIGDLVEKVGADRVLLMTKDGNVELKGIKRESERDYCVLIGGFPRGNFISSKDIHVRHERVRVFDKEIPAYIAEMQVLCWYR